MTLNDALECARFMLRENIPFMLRGSPGTGKSEGTTALVESEGYVPLVVNLSTLESVDVRGLPSPDGKGGVVWLRPDFVSDAWRLNAETGKPVFIFFDEVNAAPVSVQVPLMQLFSTGHIGPHTFPEGTRFGLAGNLVSDRAAATRMGTALNNRLANFEIDSPASIDGVKAWARWAAGAGIHPMVIAFIMLRGAPNGTDGKPGYSPGLLHWFNPNDATAYAFPSPRSWAKVSRIADAPVTVLSKLVASLVGPIAAAEFMGFVKVFKSAPPVSAILANPKGATVPTEAGVQYAVTLALARAATPLNFDSVLTYVQRLGAEFEVVCATDAVRRNPDLTSTHAFVAWAARNSDVTI